MEKERSDCSICSPLDQKIVHYDEVNLNLCKTCGLIWQPDTDQSITDSIYNENYMMDYTVIPSYYPMLVGRFFLVDTVRAMMIPDKEASLLDVGCHTGGLLRLIKPVRNYSKVAGVDVNQIALKHLHGIQTYTDFFSIKEQYDVVTFFDSIEHFFHLRETLSHLADIIKPKVVVVSVPNAVFNDQTLLNILDWHHYKPNEHIYYFNKDTLQAAFAQFNYEMMSCVYTESIIRNKKGPDHNIITAVFKKN